MPTFGIAALGIGVFAVAVWLTVMIAERVDANRRRAHHKHA